MDITWNPEKARQNARKHGGRFPDVETVFYDPFALYMPDAGSGNEQRFIAIGMDSIERTVVVVYTWRGKTVRVISARKASRSEKEAYEKGIRL